MRSPSSLIFIVLIGVWAAYFVQYWIRRRDHLSTARSVDQFTEAMRVLERRGTTTPYEDLSAPARASYRMHPERSARPQVLVKRAVPTESPRAREVSVPVTSQSTTLLDPTSPTGRPSAQGPATHSAGVPRSRVRPSRRVRGLVLLGSLVALLVVAALAAFSILPVWTLAPVILAPALCVVWIRSALRAEQAAVRARRRRAAAETRRRSTEAAPARASATGSATRGEAARERAVRPEVTRDDVALRDHARAEVAAVEVAQPEVGEPAAEAVLVSDGSVVVGVTEAPPALVDEDDIPLTWDPVPVPRPTYTMKAKAVRPDPAPAETTPAARPVERDDTAYEPRQVAGA